MNKLWIFGASMSCAFVDNGNGGQIVDWLKDWPTIVKERFGYDEVKNFSGAGDTNFETLLNFIFNREDIGQNDLVILQFSSFSNVKLLPSQKRLLELEYDVVETLGGLDNLIEVHNNSYVRDWYEKQFVNWLKKRGIKFVCWASNEGSVLSTLVQLCKNRWIHTFESEHEFAIFDHWQSKCADQWIIRDNNLIDKHFNQLGHDRFADLVIKHIIKYNLCIFILNK